MILRPSLLLATLALLSGCGSTLVHPQGQSLARGQTVSTPVAPAVRTGCSATLRRAGQTFKFDVWMEVDSSSGRLDAVGPFNTPLASVVWGDSSWKAWLPGQNILLRGTGPSLSLPVLDLKDIRPAALVAPLLGRSTQVHGPVRVVPSPSEQVAVLPATVDPGWSLLLDGRSGLPLRRQTLVLGRETEGVSFSHWKLRDGILVPGHLTRTTPDGQVLDLVVKDWSTLPEVPKAHLALRPPEGIDTITIGRQDNGRKVFRIRAGTGDSTVVVLPQGGFRPAVETADPDSIEDSGNAEEPDDESTEAEDPAEPEDDPAPVGDGHPAATTPTRALPDSSRRR